MQKEQTYFLTSENNTLFEIRKTKTKQKLSTTYRTLFTKTSTNKTNISSPF